MSDGRSGAEWPIDRRRDRIDTGPPPSGQSRYQDAPRARETRVESRRGGLNPIFIALGGLLLLGLLLWLFIGRGNSDQDKLNTGANSQKSAAADPEKMCGTKATYDLVKRELFRRAAQVRG